MADTSDAAGVRRDLARQVVGLIVAGGFTAFGVMILASALGADLPLVLLAAGSVIVALAWRMFRQPG